MRDTVPSRPQFNETFACTPSDARRARKAVATFAKAWLRGVDSADFETAVGGALANAIEHGKCSRLTVDCRYARKRVVAEIRQNGLGFNPPRKGRVPAQGAGRGFGLFIMRTVLDHVEYREHGTRVRLVKRTAAD
jgi:anti-sigma regulatory factor (Ser/Thr protein kinase)